MADWGKGGILPFNETEPICVILAWETAVSREYLSLSAFFLHTQVTFNRLSHAEIPAYGFLVIIYGIPSRRFDKSKLLCTRKEINV